MIVDAMYTVADLLALSLMLGNVVDDAAVRQFDDTVGVFFGKIAVVRNDKHELFLGKCLQGIKDLLARVRVKRTRGLVCHDDLRLFYKGTRNGNTLLLTARKLVGLAVCVADKVDLCEDRLDRFACRLFALQLERKADVCTHGEIVQYVILLKDEADKGVTVGIKIRADKILRGFAHNTELALIVAVKSADDVQKR